MPSSTNYTYFYCSERGFSFLFLIMSHEGLPSSDKVPLVSLASVNFVSVHSESHSQTHAEIASVPVTTRTLTLAVETQTLNVAVDHPVKPDPGDCDLEKQNHYDMQLQLQNEPELAQEAPEYSSGAGPEAEAVDSGRVYDQVPRRTVRDSYGTDLNQIGHDDPHDYVHPHSHLPLADDDGVGLNLVGPEDPHRSVHYHNLAMVDRIAPPVAFEHTLHEYNDPLEAQIPLPDADDVGEVQIPPPHVEPVDEAETAMGLPERSCLVFESLGRVHFRLSCVHCRLRCCLRFRLNCIHFRPHSNLETDSCAKNWNYQSWQARGVKPAPSVMKPFEFVDAVGFRSITPYSLILNASEGGVAGPAKVFKIINAISHRRVPPWSNSWLQSSRHRVGSRLGRIAGANLVGIVKGTLFGNLGVLETLWDEDDIEECENAFAIGCRVAPRAENVEGGNWDVVRVEGNKCAIQAGGTLFGTDSGEVSGVVDGGKPDGCDIPLVNGCCNGRKEGTGSLAECEVPLDNGRDVSPVDAESRGGTKLDELSDSSLEEESDDASDGGWVKGGERGGERGGEGACERGREGGRDEDSDEKSRKESGAAVDIVCCPLPP
ncbi:hypothetical protein G7046_g7739 [Stylonectria norvegica]|nr:hypothetical protein G7046_g7739 [Stylonectria norvegica]